MGSSGVSSTFLVSVRVQSRQHGQSEHGHAAEGTLAGAVELDLANHLRRQQERAQTLLHACFVALASRRHSFQFALLLPGSWLWIRSNPCCI